MTDETDLRVEYDARVDFETRHAQRLLRLMTERSDLRGVYALADQMGEAVLWCA